MPADGTVVFDIIGTCFNLDAARRRLTELGAPHHALELWFAQTLRDAIALSHAGGYRPLRDVLRAELPRTLAALGLRASPGQLDAVVAGFAELDPQPGFAKAAGALADAGWKLLALTNGAEVFTRGLLQRAGVEDRFAAVLSCDAIGRFKPHRDVYEAARRVAEGDVWMVAAHAWDVAGAAMAGLRTVYVTAVEGAYLDVYPEPDVTVERLADVPARLAAHRRERPATGTPGGCA